MDLDSIIDSHIEIINSVKSMESEISAAYTIFLKAILSGKKILICGNGGSACDAQHMATELMIKFKRERHPLAAIALGADVAMITAMSNDYDFNDLFARQIEALGRPGDVLVAISTSGNSSNIIRAVNTARAHDMRTISLIGNTGGRLRTCADVDIIINSPITARVQEAHIMIIHILCELLDKL